MPITLIAKAPQTISETSSNGGIMTNTDIVATRGGYGNFPVLNKAEKISGATKIRKFFCKLHDTANQIAIKGVAFIRNVTLKTDSLSYMILGTQRDQQGAMGARKYATGLLNTAVNALDNVLIVDFEAGNGANNVVQAGDSLIVDIDGLNESYDLTVASVVWTVDQAEITLTTGVLTNLASGVKVGSCIVDTTNINTASDNIVKSFSTSTYDEVTYPVLTENVSTIEETITITITGTNTFSAISDMRGSLPNGSTLTDYAPINAAFSLPYFTLQAAGWGGTHTNGETLQFQVHPAAIPVWAVLTTNAAAADGTDTVYVGFRVES